jgi:hypothetical protein
MKFSDRIGITSVRDSLQIDSIDKKLTNKLWNEILTNYFERLSDYDRYGKETDKSEVVKTIWLDFFDNRIDLMPDWNGKPSIGSIIEYIKNWYFESQWYEKYNFLEFIVNLRYVSLPTNVVESFNKVLKGEMAGYRIINRQITQVTNEEEIIEIEQAINDSGKWKTVNTHLKTSLSLFSNRENPDFRNSVKESISAVESFCIIIANDKNATLGKALSKIEEKYKIHKSLKKAFSAIYGYTSDSGGIRHSLLEDDIEVTMEDAKFMLVSCSSFINYLKVKFENN